MNIAANPGNTYVRNMKNNLPVDGFKWWNRVSSLPEEIVDDITNESPAANHVLHSNPQVRMHADGTRIRRVVWSTIPGAQ